MEKKKSVSIKKNYLYNMAYQLLIMILPLITAPYLARVVEPEGTGIYSYTFSIAQYFMFFGMLGISNHGNRSIAMIRDNESERNKVFSSIYYLQIVTCLFVSILYTIYCFLIVKDNIEIAFLQLFFVVSGILDISWYFFGLENFKITVSRQILIKIITCACIFIFVKEKNDLWVYTLILSLGTFLSQAYLFLYIRKYAKFVKVSWHDISKHIKPIIILFIPIIATSIYRVMDKVMIGALSNMDQVGYYENSDKLINTCLGIVGALGAVMLPQMSNLIAKGEIEKSKKYLARSMEFTMFIACGIAFGIACVSDEFIVLFYGDKFENCINVTKLLSISALFISWANVIRMQYLIPMKKDKVYVISIVIGAIINVVINLALIPKYGAIGAAIGTICAEGSVMLIQTFASYKDIPILKFFLIALPYLLFGTIFFLAVRFESRYLSGTYLKLIIEILTGGIIYLILCVVYVLVSKNEVYKIIKERFSKGSKDDRKNY